MKVSEFIKWLETQDQDATVEILVHDSKGSYYEQGGTVSEQAFDPNDINHFDYTDFRGNQFVKETDSYYNARTLLIGGKV